VPVPDKRWKRVEREKCRALGFERSGPTGRDLPDCADMPLIGLEVKSYKTFVFLEADWEQAVANAEKLGLIPALAVKETGRNGRDRVQMRWDDYKVLLRHLGDFCPLEIGGMTQLVKNGEHRLRMDWDLFALTYRLALAARQEA